MISVHKKSETKDKGIEEETTKQNKTKIKRDRGGGGGGGGQDIIVSER